MNTQNLLPVDNGEERISLPIGHEIDQDAWLLARLWNPTRLLLFTALVICFMKPNVFTPNGESYIGFIYLLTASFIAYAFKIGDPWTRKRFSYVWDYSLCLCIELMEVICFKMWVHSHNSLTLGSYFILLVLDCIVYLSLYYRKLIDLANE